MPDSDPSPQPAPPPSGLGLVGATGIGVAAIVGGGVFVLGGVAVAEAGPAAMVAFALNGALAVLTALVFAELATTFPENGGQYVYARRTFSVQAAFGVGWVMTFAHVVAAVLYALGFAAYGVEALGALAPAAMQALGGMGGTGPDTGGAIRALTLGLALLATALYGWRLTRGVAGGGKVENVGKLVVFGILIAAGLAVMVQRGPAEALAPLSPFFERGAAGVVAAMGFTFITFQGFELIAGVAGEVREPRRTIPRAMFASLGVALAVYLPLLLVVASVGLPPGATSPSQLARDNPETFFAVAASSYLGAFGFWLVIVAALLSTLTALQANLLAGSRVALAMARHRTLPRGLAREDPRTGAPLVAILFVCGSVALLILAIPDLAAAGAAASLVFLLTFGVTHLCSWQVRRRSGGGRAGAGGNAAGEGDGSFRAPLFPLVPLVGILGCGALVVFQLVTVPSAGLLLAAWIGVGALVYAGFLSSRAEALDAAVAGGDPQFTRLRGARPTVLVPLANPARAGGLASVAGALAPPGVGRILLHQVVVADAGSDEAHLRQAMSEGGEALSNALVRTRHEGVETELLLSVAEAPWDAIARVAREEGVNSVLLGLAQVPGGEGGEGGEGGAGGDGPPDPAPESHPLDRLLQRLPSDVALLHAQADFDLDRVRRVLIPLSGHNDHDRLRARVIGTLARKGLEHLAFLHVLRPDATPEAEVRAHGALEAYLRDEARGQGEAAVVRAEDAIGEIVRRAEGYDLLILGITRPRGGASRLGGLLARMVREAPCPVLIISHPPLLRGRGGRPF